MKNETKIFQSHSIAFKATKSDDGSAYIVSGTAFKKLVKNFKSGSFWIQKPFHCVGEIRKNYAVVLHRCSQPRPDGPGWSPCYNK